MTNSIKWSVSKTLVPYDEAVAYMEERVAAIAMDEAPELVWLLEHPPLYTAGTSASETDLLTPDRLPVYKSGRGGQYTYHGPGQRVAYVMLDVKKRGHDVRAFVTQLETWLIQTLAQHDIHAETRCDRVGVWVPRPEMRPNKEDKIAAIGIRLRKWVSFHGIALNVNPDLAHFSGIVPCGITVHGVTSLHDLGHPVSMTQVDQALRKSFEEIFGPTELCEDAPYSLTSDPVSPISAS